MTTERDAWRVGVSGVGRGFPTCGPGRLSGVMEVQLWELRDRT